ncbi:hypothetical protein [Rhizobium sp. 9140]|uniref:hypothetical protein n=1 Tax=Rhizobium sp. 9140 TaxID=1761900 RepID=UPI00079B6169|nr:hypothetical protein [Rhizobium sp. 9140]CZT36156.1 hypothetical protein GA0004734_00031580 [Rhizobium sp. 9140]
MARLQRGPAITAHIDDYQRGFLRRLSERDGKEVFSKGSRQRLAGEALVQAGYARTHAIFSHAFEITPAGDYYLDRLLGVH